MASISRSINVPLCMSCVRRFVGSEFSFLASPVQIQVRGKKKKVKLPSTIHVKLLRDIAGYGPKGSIVPVARGRMRNIWYPDGRADYMTFTQLRERKDELQERDYAFGMKTEESGEEKKKLDQSAQIDAKVDVLPPERTKQLLEFLIPPVLEFFRPVIRPHEEPKLDAGTPPAVRQPMPIFGSVTTTDILTSVKALLSARGAEAGGEDALRVVLGPEHIGILGSREGGESDRIKVLGEFEVEVRAKGVNAVRRRVLVKEVEDFQDVEDKLA